MLGLALSAYLGWHFLTDGSVIGCSGGSACDEVLNSRWASIAGVLPVSGLAAGAYLAMLAAGLFIGPTTEAPARRLAWAAMLMLAVAAAGSAVWFIILQKWIIGAFCLYCMAAHINGLLLAALVIWRVFGPFDNDSTNAPRRLIGLVPTIGLAMLGLAMAGTLAACQVIVKPPAVYLAGQSQDNRPAVELHSVPLVGSPDARYVVILLFDYQCPHCQQMHFMLNEVVRRCDGKLAFALCPSPLDSRCNPYIPQGADHYKNSCELAEISLAIWRADRQAFAAFENWMFTFDSGDRWKPRSLEAAGAKAVELLGQAPFDAARADPWIDAYLQTCIQMYGRTIQDGKGAVPKLVFGSRWVIPEPYNADDLMMILQDTLAVPLHDIAPELCIPTTSSAE